MLILAYSAWSITTVNNQLRIIIISVYSQFYCNIWAIKGTYGFISNGSELKHQSRADVLHRLVIWHWEDISPPPPHFVILTVFQSIYFQLGSRGFHTSFLPSLFSRTFAWCTKATVTNNNLAYLVFFMSLHLLCLQQEHLKIKEFR